MTTSTKTRLGLAAGLMLGTALPAAAQSDSLTLCWAAWDPANALVELSKDFTAESGIAMNFEFVPWPNFADRILNELNSGGKLCDLLIGDSQWLGGSAENGYYVKLNDFFEAEGISMDDFAPATVYAYSTWPKGTPNYWALPAMGDANGWFYRKDWFENPEIMADFKEKYGRDLRRAEDLGRVQGGRRVLPGPRDRRQDRLRRGDLHRARLRRHHHGRDLGALSVRLQVREPSRAPTTWRARSTRPTRSQGLEFYKALYECCTPPGYTDSYMEQGLDAFKSGQVAMMMNWFAFMPGMAKDEVVGDGHRLLRQPRRRRSPASTLGGQGISVVANTDNMDGALAYIKWFAQPDVQKKWWELGGFSATTRC